MTDRKNIYPTKISVSDHCVCITDLCTNGVYCFEKETAELSLIKFSFETNNSFYNFSNIIKIDNSFCIVPRFHDRVEITDTNGKSISSISNGLISCEGKAHFFKAFREKNKIVMLPLNEEKIKVLKIDSNTIDSIETPRLTACSDYYLINDHAYISQMNKNELVKIKLNDGSFEILRINEIEDGIESIGYIDDSSYCFSRIRSPELYLKTNGEAMCLPLPKDGPYICRKIKEKVFLFARDYFDVEMFDLTTRKFENITEIFCYKDNGEKAQYFMDAQIDSDETTIWIIDSYHGVLFRFETNSMQVVKHELTIPDSERDAITDSSKSIFYDMSHGNSSQNILSEIRGLYELRGYIDAVIENNELMQCQKEKKVRTGNNTNYGKMIYNLFAEKS